MTFQLGDGLFHYRAVMQVTHAHAAGIVYPRWLPEQLLGLGDASFMHYPPLFHGLAAVAATVIGSSWAGMRLVLLLSTLMAGSLSYRFFEKTYPPEAAICGALLLEANPLMVHLMFKAEAYPWVTAYPFILLFFILLVDLPPRLLVPQLSLVISVTALPHILTCFMLLVIAPVAIIFTGVIIRRPWRATLRNVAQIVVSAIVGIGIAGIYVVPAVTTLRYVTPASWHFTRVCSPNQAFVFPVFTHQLGVCWSSYQILFPAIAVTLCVCTTWMLMRGACKNKAAVALYLSSAIAALLFASEISFPLWQFQSPLSFVQFPSRFDSLAFAVALMGFSMTAMSTWSSKSGINRVAVAVAAALPLVCLAVLEFDVIRHGHAMTLSDHLTNNTTVGTLGEYRPATLRPNYEKYVAAGGFTAECQTSNAVCKTDLRDSKRQMFQIDSPVSQTVRLPLASYPAWVVYVNGHAARRKVDNDTGLLQVAVEAGRSKIEVRWRLLPEEWVGLGISLAGIFAPCAFGLRKGMAKKLGEPGLFELHPSWRTSIGTP